MQPSESITRSSKESSLWGFWGILEAVLPIALVAGLARISVAQDVFSQLSRPLVMGILQAFHVPCSDNGHQITVGRLEIPWTGDCAGLNLLVLLLAVAIWLNRHEPFNIKHWVRILGMVPAAVIANVCRVFTLIGYRELIYPSIETPQLHYFFGLFWLVPFAFLAMPPSPRHLTARVFELLHVATVIALLAPETFAPDGLGMTMAVVLALSHCRIPENISRRRVVMMGVWILAAVLLSISGMESFWLPWMLLCPLMSDAKWIFSIPGAIIIMSAHPLFGLIPGASIITWSTVAYLVWDRFIIEQPKPPGNDDPHIHWTWRERSLLAGSCLLFLLPFISSTLIQNTGENWVPPKIADLKTIPGNGYLVTLPGQSNQIGMLWYNPSGTHRHHTLKICLKYSGVELEPTKDDPGVFTDGGHWFKEFFLQNGKLIPTHVQYLISTATPASSPGIHLILVCDSSSMSAQKFDEAANKLVEELFNLIKREKNQKISDAMTGQSQTDHQLI